MGYTDEGGKPRKIEFDAKPTGDETPTILKMSEDGELRVCQTFAPDANRELPRKIFEWDGAVLKRKGVPITLAQALTQEYCIYIQYIQYED